MNSPERLPQPAYWRPIIGAIPEQDFTQSRKRASSSGREKTTKDDGEQGVSEIIERERRNLQRACALLDCLRIASMYDYEEEIDPGMWRTS